MQNSKSWHFGYSKTSDLYSEHKRFHSLGWALKYRHVFFLNFMSWMRWALIKHSSIPFSSSKTVVSLAELDCASPGASPVVSDSSSLFELGMVRGKKKTNRDTTRAIVPNMRKPSHQAPIQRGSLGVIVVASKSKKHYTCV